MKNKLRNILIMHKIEKKMINGYDDFYNYYCISKKDWDEIKERVEK